MSTKSNCTQYARVFESFFNDTIQIAFSLTLIMQTKRILRFAQTLIKKATNKYKKKEKKKTSTQ